MNRIVLEINCGIMDCDNCQFQCWKPGLGCVLFHGNLESKNGKAHRCFECHLAERQLRNYNERYDTMFSKVLELEKKMDKINE